MKQILNIQECLKLYSSQKLYHFSKTMTDLVGLYKSQSLSQRGIGI